MSVLWSLDPTSVLLGGVVVLCVLWWLSTRRPPGLPPGPGPALPLLGHLHLLAKDPRPQFWAWRRRYGDVFSLYMGGRLVVVLASYSAIHEAFVTFADVFSDRPHLFVTARLFKDKGLVFTSGRTWKEQRKISIEILRAMGMGKNVLAEKIQEEITHYIRAIKDHQGAPVDLTLMTQVSVSNNICSILFGKRYDYQDPEFLSYMQLVHTNLVLLSGTAGPAILNILPVLRYIPGDLFKFKELLANYRAVCDFMDNHVADHQKNVHVGEEENPENVDFIDSYLHQMQKNKTLGNVDSTLKGENLQKSLTNLFSAGTDTTSTALGWALLFFLHHPHVQDRCFQDISDLIGPHRPPSMSDKPNLPYLEATIYEVLRKGDMGPFAIHHATARDVTFRGFLIPKGAVIVPFISCALHDPEIWGDPDNFRPERFIGPDGRLIKPDEFIPFSTGRRMCPGEALARMELFLYLTTLIQHFHFLPAEEGQLPSLEGVLGLAYFPHPYKIRAVPRM